MPFPVNNDGNSFSVGSVRADQERARRTASRAAPGDREGAADAAEVTHSSGPGAAESRIQSPELAAEAAQFARRLMSQNPGLGVNAQAHATPQGVLAALRS